MTVIYDRQEAHLKLPGLARSILGEDLCPGDCYDEKAGVRVLPLQAELAGHRIRDVI
jgi:hypothetical protein